MYIIVGLGNPGIAYANTRHNTGFKVIDSIAKELKIELNKNKFQGLYGETNYNNQKVILIKPQTYMNLSGECVSEIVNFYKISLENLLIIYDDIDLKLGAIRIKQKGSAGTHNGMRNIIEELDTEEIPRIRVGIGKPKNTEIDLSDYVLGKFYLEDEETINESIEKAKKATISILDNGIQKTISRYN